MAEKRQRDSLETSSSSDLTSKIRKAEPVSFDEVKAIIIRNDSEKLRQITEQGLLDINDEGNSVLRCICVAGRVKMLSYLIEHGISTDDDVIFDLLCDSRIISNTDIATILVNKISDVNRHSNWSFLHCACSGGNEVIVQQLLERAADNSTIVDFDDPLVVASERGFAGIVQLLLGWNKGEKMRSSRLEIALSCASEAGFVDVIECLIAYGVDHESLNIALYAAVRANQAEAAACLLDHGADVNYTKGKNSTMIIMIYSLSSLIRLVPAGGDSLLRLAAFKLKILTMLLERGADPDTHFADGCTLLFVVVDANSHDLQTLSLLLKHHADPNLAHRDTGVTPLMIAAVENNRGYMRLLLEAGADVTQVSHAGQDVFDWLDDRGRYHREVELCIQYVDINRPGAKLLLK